MTDWFAANFPGGVATATGLLAGRIGVALALGLAVAGLNRWARRGEAIPPTFTTTLVLLAALIAMATQIIGENIARAFSLVGALSVVRFRTVVKDSQDTAFVLFAVVVGMAAGADHLAVGLVGLAVLGLAAVALWPPGRRGRGIAVESSVSFRASVAGGAQGAAEASLAVIAERFDLTAVSTAKQGAFLDLSYRVRLRPGTSPAALAVDLDGLPGVENVEIKRVD